MKGQLHYIREDLVLIDETEAWILAWLAELLEWPARYEAWRS